MSKRTATIVGLGAAAGVIALGAARRRRTVHPSLPTVDGGSSTKLETSDGAVLEVHIAGEGPTVVLPHCWMGDMRIWEPVAARLIDGGHRVIRYDQRGHGSSTVGAGGCSVERLGDDLAELLEHLDVRDAVVAGHSMGGMTAQAFAIHRPEVAGERVRALVLVATASKNYVEAGRALELGLGTSVAERAMRSRYGHLFMRGTHGAKAHPAAVRLSRDTLVDTPASVRVNQGRALLEMDLEEGRTRITHPTTIVVGTRDTVTPPARAREMEAGIPGARLVTLPGKGHYLPLEATDEVAGLIAEAAR